MAQKLYKPLLIDSVKASTNLPKHRFVGFDGGICAAGAKAIGICDVETDAGQQAPIGVIGILLIESGGAITQGIAITSDALGRAIVASEAQKSNGYAQDSASAEGEIIRIVRGI